MPPRRTSFTSTVNSRNGFAPSADVASYKDLLLFEERLKQNAALLRSRKRKYEIFLAILVVSILVLVHKSFLQPSPTPSLHYLHLSLLPVAVVTLLLFFASGMYAERIGYANRYVPHANRALRSLNMHLNMRVSPKPLIPYIPFPLSLLVPSSLSSSATSPSPRSPSISPTTLPSSSKSQKPASGPNPKPIPAIPPTKNPRGELIFSSRVDRVFRDGYERYRALFEKKREERYRELRARKKGLTGIWWKLLGYRSTQPKPMASGSPSSHSPAPSKTSSQPTTPPLSRIHSTLHLVPNSSIPTNRSRSRTPSPSVSTRAMTEKSRSTKLSSSPTRSEGFEPIPEIVSVDQSSGREGRPMKIGRLPEEKENPGLTGRSRAESFSFLLETGRQVGSAS